MGKNTDFIVSDKDFSTLRSLVKQAPSIEADPKDKIQSILFLSENIERKSEGGLRTQGAYKCTMPECPLVSVVTVVFNGAQYIEEAIQSVLNQTYDNVEYIVIDGGSNDSTIDIIKKYGDQIDYWVSESDDGIADAFNKGISLCAGEIIGIINADDWYELDAIEKMVNCNNKSAVFCGNVQYWDKYEKDYIFSTNIHGLSKEMTVNHPAVFIPKSIYKVHGVFDCKYLYAMDYEILLRFYKNGVEFIAIDHVLSNMRLSGVSDANWVKSYGEVRAAKIQHGEPVLSAYSYYFKQLLRKKMAYLLSSCGLETIVMIYRRKFSIIKKQRSDNAQD